MMYTSCTQDQIPPNAFFWQRGTLVGIIPGLYSDEVDGGLYYNYRVLIYMLDRDSHCNSTGPCSTIE